MSKVLVYELHVTNFDVAPLTLKRISVFTLADHPQLLTALEEEKLSTATVRVGSPMVMSSGSKAGEQDTRTINPGDRNVIFLWVELPANQPVPSKLKHQLVFSSIPAGTDRPSEATLESFVVLVDQGPVPMLGPPFRGGIWLAIDGHIYSPERFAVDG